MWKSGRRCQLSVGVVVEEAGHRCLVLVLVADHIAWARVRISCILISCWSSCLLSMRVLSSALCSMMASSVHCCASRRRITCMQVNNSSAHSSLGVNIYVVKFNVLGQPDHITPTLG